MRRLLTIKHRAEDGCNILVHQPAARARALAVPLLALRAGEKPPRNYGRVLGALFALAAFTATAIGQPSGGPPQQPKAAEKKADPTDAAIAAALANDPDVRMAKAKIQLAEAELAKARQMVTLRALAVKAAVEEHKAAVTQHEDRVTWAERMVKLGNMTQAQMIAERDKLAAAKAALARAETEWKLLTGGAAGAADPTQAQAIAAGLTWLTKNQDSGHADAATLYYLAMQAARERTAVKGPIPDRIRAALDKPVKLGAKGEKVTFAQAAAAFKKDAGLDVPVRENARLEPIVSEGEELPVGAWFQLFADGNLDVRFLVREYGLLVTPKAMAPPDALGVIEFWKQKLAPPAKETKPASK
jgi:hypothetical protein